MEETILSAVERTLSPKQCRAAGFTPGVLYGNGIASSTVQFETAALKKVITAHGSNAKVWVLNDNNKKFGIIKEVQRDPVTAKVIHIEVNLLSQEHEVKMQIPILFEGQDNLKNARLQVHKSEIEVMGKAMLMPDTVVIDVSAMTVGDAITSVNFAFDKQIKIIDSQDEVYGVIKSLRDESEAVAAATGTEPEKKA